MKWSPVSASCRSISMQRPRRCELPGFSATRLIAPQPPGPPLLLRRQTGLAGDELALSVLTRLFVVLGTNGLAAMVKQPYMILFSTLTRRQALVPHKAACRYICGQCFPAYCTQQAHPHMFIRWARRIYSVLDSHIYIAT